VNIFGIESDWIVLALAVGAGLIIAFVYPKVRFLWRDQLPDPQARRMIERRLSESEDEVTAALVMRDELERGTDLLEARAKLEPAWLERRETMSNGASWWRPEMIGDDGLKVLCRELDRTSKGVFFEALAVHSSQTSEAFLHNVGPRIARLEELKSLIRATMAETGWVEVEDRD